MEEQYKILYDKLLWILIANKQGNYPVVIAYKNDIDELLININNKISENKKLKSVQQLTYDLKWIVSKML